MLEQIIELIKHKNRKLKEVAADTFESFISDLSETLSENQTSRLVEFFVNRIKHVIETSTDSTEVMVCIRCYGLFSKSIKNCKGEDTLHDHFLL